MIKLEKPLTPKQVQLLYKLLENGDNPCEDNKKHKITGVDCTICRINDVKKFICFSRNQQKNIREVLHADITQFP